MDVLVRVARKWTGVGGPRHGIASIAVPYDHSVRVRVLCAWNGTAGVAARIVRRGACFAVFCALGALFNALHWFLDVGVCLGGNLRNDQIGCKARPDCLSFGPFCTLCVAFVVCMLNHYNVLYDRLCFTRNQL